jgi:single-stranded-DNA-specific exonuclease
MPSAIKRWKVLEHSDSVTESLQSQLKIHPLLCRLLTQRGIVNFEDAKQFFRPELSALHDPFLMKDMDKATERILSAIKNKEKILVFGDYDVDGTSSVAIVYDFLSKIYGFSNIDYYIPNRYKEGYGLSKLGIEYAEKGGFSLLITLDCGIKSVELIESCNEKGIDVIVCDHHLPGPVLPKAHAILNAKQPDCPYPYKELCGCGVGFKLIQALSSKLNLPEKMYLPYLELVATAIASDIVPITGENRVMAHFGLKQVNSNPSTGIKALIDLSGTGTSINISSLSYLIGPRINAAGRMDDAKKAVALFIEKDPAKAIELANQLQLDNLSRREADASITEEAILMMDEDILFASQKSTVVYNPLWHKGVIGIVASRLIDKAYRPTIVLTKSGEFLTGSARSIPGFNIHDALEKCQDLLVSFGGHYFAAGLTLKEEKFDEFKKRFEEVSQACISPEMMHPEIIIDASLDLADCTDSFFNILSQMEPFGPENLKPVFLIKGVMNTGTRIVKEEHVRFEVSNGNHSITGISFKSAEKFKSIFTASHFDLVCTLEENYYRDKRSLQLKVLDFEEAGKKEAV